VGFGRYDKGVRTGYVYQSTDGGQNWNQISQLDDLQIDDMAVDKDSPPRVFMATNKGVYLSKDSGETWNRVFDTSADAIAISPDDPTEIFAGCYDGVFASFDGGQSWAKVTDESDYHYVHCLRIHEATQTLYAGFHEKGLLTYRESERHVVGIIAGEGGTTKPEPGIYFYPPQAEITLRAIPDPYYLFKGWSGSKSGKNNPLKVTVGSDMTFKAEFYVPVFPPSEFRGEQVLNRSLTQQERINILRWQMNPENSNIKKYEIYQIREGVFTLVAEVGAETFEYWDRGVLQNQEYSYAIVAVHVTGEKSDPAYTTIQ
jgi:hypothetical protein